MVFPYLDKERVIIESVSKDIKINPKSWVGGEQTSPSFTCALPVIPSKAI